MKTAKKKTVRTISVIPFRIGVMESLRDEPRRKVWKEYDNYTMQNGQKVNLRQYILTFLESLPKGQGIKNISGKNIGIQLDNTYAIQETESEIRCVIKTGSYGFSADLLNIETNNVKKRDPADCELIPFICRFIFSKEHCVAILLVERFGQYTATSGIFSALEDYVNRTLPKECSLNMQWVTSPEYIKQNIRANVKAFRFIWHKIPSDIADTLGQENETDREGGMDLRVKAGIGKFWCLPNWFDWRKTNKAGIFIGGEDYDEMKVEMELDGRQRTVSVQKLDCFQMAFDITDTIKLNTDGHPIPDSFYSASEETLEVVKKAMSW